MILNLLLLLLMAACLGFLSQEGIWSNAIRLINVVTAALLATNFFEPVAEGLRSFLPRHDAYLDFVSLWVLFSVFMAVMRVVTDLASRAKMRFPPIVDRIGSPILAAWIGWVMICFTMMTFHTAPLPGQFFHGSFRPQERMFFGTAPDRMWLGFAQRMSWGTLSRARDPNDPDGHIFDPDGLFILKYEARRAALAPNVPQTGPGI